MHGALSAAPEGLHRGRSGRGGRGAENDDDSMVGGGGGNIGQMRSRGRVSSKMASADFVQASSMEMSEPTMMGGGMMAPMMEQNFGTSPMPDMVMDEGAAYAGAAGSSSGRRFAGPPGSAGEPWGGGGSRGDFGGTASSGAGESLGADVLSEGGASDFDASSVRATPPLSLYLVRFTLWS